jgi:protein TonB
MPSALLLSPDDQVVTAVTAVLEEMFVSCERPLDAVSAAKKLNSENFDLVLVDCENLPAAKLIFDVCRRGKDGHMSIPIAIVDGHAGLPTAFRLGADLVLTKPVARDQARSTIRSAVNRVKKEQPAVYAAAGDAIGADATHADATHNDAVHADTTHDHVAPDVIYGNTQPSDLDNSETVHANTDLISNHNYEQASSVADTKPAGARAMAAAASAGTSADGLSHGSTEKPEPAPPVLTMCAAAAPAIVEPEISSVVGADDIASESAKSAPANNAAFANTPPANAPVADEDASKNEKTPKWKPAPTSRLVFAGTENQGAAKKKSRDVLPMVAAVVVLCGGICAAWLTQPGFRTAVRAKFEHALTAAGLAKHPQMPAPASVKPAATKPAVASVQPGPAKPSGVSPTPVTSGQGAPLASSAASATTSVAVTATHPASNASSTPASSTPTTKSTAPSSTAPSQAGQSAARTPPPANTHKHISISGDPDADLTVDQIQVVLPAKSAQERLISSVPPVYPVAAQPSTTDNSVILKAAIDETGKVAAAQLVDGDSILGRAAIAAVKRWRYQPYLQNGKAVPFQTIVLVDVPRH